MRTLSIIAFISFYFSCTAQIKFTVIGKIEQLSKAKHVSLGCSGGEFPAEIRPDGSFIIQGKAPEPSAGLISTDSSGSDAIWLDNGNYTIVCREITMEGIKGYLFRIPKLKGPQDAELYNGWNEPRFYFKGTGVELRAKYKNHSVKYLDSLFNNFPDSKIIPEVLRLSRPLIGDEAAQLYMSSLNKEQVTDHNYRSLKDYFKRKDKIEKEKYFEDFSMTDDQGKDFKISSLADKKLILVDFWSSDCVPCRRNHLKLVELYKKYSVKGLGIVSVSLDDNKSEWLKAVQKDNMTWINVSDLRGWHNSLAEDYFISSIPSEIWLDGKRKIIGAYLSDKEIEEYLK
ncbi:MAG TPA: TlpA disulfide reductase family protein [Chitinophagaceae bacterium]|nr:TlpA disulfide reductase family protein [Chitinophagaceae bacterium]